MTTLSLQGETIYDISVRVYGSIDLIGKLMNDNNISGINSTINSNTLIYYDESLFNANHNISISIPENINSFYLTPSGQTVYDVCLSVYGTLDYLLKLLSDNSLSLTNNFVPANTHIVYDPALFNKNNSVVSITPISNIVNNYFSFPSQSIFDIALQLYGSIDLLIKLMNDNALNGINSYFGSHTSFSFDSSMIFNLQRYSNNFANGIIYSTGNQYSQISYELEPDGTISSEPNGQPSTRP